MGEVGAFVGESREVSNVSCLCVGSSFMADLSSPRLIALWVRAAAPDKEWYQDSHHACLAKINLLSIVSFELTGVVLMV